MDWVLLTDIDGTLDYHCRGISHEIYLSTKKYLQLGGGLGLATGRSLISTTKTAKKMGVNIPSILLGGSMVYDYIDKRVRWTCTFPKYVQGIVEEVALRFTDVAILVYTEKEIFLHNSNKLLRHKAVPEERKAAKSFHIKGNILKINIVGERNYIHEILNIYFNNPMYETTFASQHFAEIVSSEAGKGNAMQVLSDMLKIPVNRFIVMGDAHNDVEMLKRAGIALTLENAPEDVKTFADVILPHCKDNGATKGFVYAAEVIEKM